MILSLISLMAFAQGGPTFKLQPVTSGMTAIVGGYVPQQMKLVATPIAGLTNVPAGAAGYATWTFGGKPFKVVEVEAAGVPTKLLIDETGAGDMSKATAFDWSVKTINGGAKIYNATLKLPSPIANGKDVTVMAYHFDPADPRRAALKDTVLYYADYGLSGTMTLNGKTHKVAIADFDASGTFDNASKETAPHGPPAALLLIDRNDDGKFSGPSEEFPANKPLNLEGTTYDITGLKGSGMGLGLKKSKQTVAEVPVPPSLGAGKKVVAFTATDTSGKTVHFPQDFKGKVVMLDFWATWCGPCMGEVPTVVSVYNQLHGKGFEILGISLDNEQTIKNIPSVTKDKGMTWDQVADGKYWQAAIAQLYGIQSIPQAYIVDGDTGMIYAEGEAIRGENLLPSVQKALSDKSKAPK